MTAEVVIRPVEDNPHSIAWGQVLFRKYEPPDRKMSRRRRRRLRGKRKAGLLPPWGFTPLGDIESFTLTIREKPIRRVRLLHQN